MGDFEKIYPTEKDYEVYLAYSTKLYEEWTGASNLKTNTNRYQEESKETRDRESQSIT